MRAKTSNRHAGGSEVIALDFDRSELAARFDNLPWNHRLGHKDAAGHRSREVKRTARSADSGERRIEPAQFLGQFPPSQAPCKLYVGHDNIDAAPTSSAR